MNVRKKMVKHFARLLLVIVLEKGTDNYALYIHLLSDES